MKMRWFTKQRWQGPFSSWMGLINYIILYPTSYRFAREEPGDKIVFVRWGR